VPPHLAHHIVHFESVIGARKYRELCEKAKSSENLEKVMKWMVERDSINSNRGSGPISSAGLVMSATSLPIGRRR